MTYATNRGLVWVLDTVKKRGGTGLPNSGTSSVGLVSGPSSLQLLSGPSMAVNPQGELESRKNVEIKLEIYSIQLIHFNTK